MRVLASLCLLLAGCSSSDFDIGSASDSGVAEDTSRNDASGTRDSAADVPPGVDAAPVCPAPPTTATYDASMLTCEQLVMAYPMRVADAKRCTCDADCSAPVPRDFCGCTTFINPGQEAAAAISAMRAAWAKKTCTTPCLDIVCPVAESARCVFDEKGIGSCVDQP